MNFLNYISVRKNSGDLSNKIFEFEQENKLQLPIAFKAFIKAFKFEEIGTKQFLRYFDTECNSSLLFYDSQYIKNNHIGIENMFSSLDDMLNTYNNLYEDDSYIKNQKLLPIGECNDQGILMLGIGEANRDQIFIEYAHLEERIHFVSETIFSFFQDYKIVPNETYLPDGISFENLFKSWGEDFWRIKE
ncbi:SMI1/KNR4 family protein [Persicobacter psychrovividus]|uniref:Knr4/Smi1-like domain-containing protein n=1 Tax=Persicobacter psychrovividus TaxID=387638 RepID=A0ABM7VD48_9BACT|nr:hypothetical protein PEPS_11390 [Persicobacter psychrovividus]